MNELNTIVQNYFVSSRTPHTNYFFYFITSFFDISVLFFAMTLVIAYVVYRVKGRKYFIFFLTNIFVTMGVVYLLKIIFNTARPEDGLIFAFGASFPSYHAAISTVFFLSLYFIFVDKMSIFFKKILYLLSLIMIFLVSLSRLYLGVHWLSDVIFGLIIGILIFYILIYLFQIKSKSL